MISPRCRGKLKSDDLIVGKRWAYGYFCRVEGKCYLILNDAEVIPEREYDDEVISGFVEVVPETVECWTIVE